MSDYFLPVTCDCKQKAVERAKALIPGALHVSYQNQDMFSGRTSSWLEVTTVHPKSGKQKKEKMFLSHSYCPHCGKKYPVKESSE